MLSKFKFLAPEQLMVHQIFGDDLGEVANLNQLDRVIRITAYFLRAHGIENWNEINFEQIIFPLMFRLYRDKNNTYRYKHVVEKIREIGQEYGATTGRPRQIRWLDIDEVLVACLRNGVDTLIINKLSIISKLIIQLITLIQ